MMPKTPLFFGSCGSPAGPSGFDTKGSRIIQRPTAVGLPCRLWIERCLPKSPDAMAPEKAARDEIRKVIIDIQRFTPLLIFIPRML